MKRNIGMLRNSGELVEMTFDQPAYDKLNWEEDNEFSYEGDMYDVAEKKVIDGKMHLLCIPDKKESKLLQQYQEQTNKSQSQDKTTLLILLATYIPASDITLPVPTAQAS